MASIAIRAIPDQGRMMVSHIVRDHDYFSTNFPRFGKDFELRSSSKVPQIRENRDLEIEF